MQPDRTARFYVSVPLAPEAPRQRGAVAQALQQIVRDGCSRREAPVEPMLVDQPSANLVSPPELCGGLPAAREVVAFVDTPRNAAAFVRQLRQGGADVTAGVDLPIAPLSWWCPGAGPAQFGDRAQANQLIRAAGLPDPGGTELVNVVIIDQGLPADFPFRGPRGGGWTVTDPLTNQVRRPFEGTGRHAAMVARNVLAYATNVRLWDCPLLPDRIDRLDSFLSYAQAAFERIRDRIKDYRSRNPGSGSWVLVNAWGVWDSRQDPPLQVPPAAVGMNYGRNIDHPLNRLVTELDEIGVDQVFAAGNCGQFCPSTRCGRLDRGPGRSIHGANSHPRVLTVGAVRTDGLWVGQSAEGPGTLAAAKPDLCAPTLFRDVLAPFEGEDNSGTSAACGVAAGVVAAMRGRQPWDQLSPEDLRARLRGQALPQGTDPTSRSRFGAGILQAA